MRKRKLLFQIGLLLTLIFVIILFLAESYMIAKSQELFLKAKDEMINKNLDSVDENLSDHKYKNLIDYMVEHADELDYNPYQIKEQDDIKDIDKETLELQEALDEKQKKFDNTGDFFDSLTDKEKWFYACCTRYIISNIVTFSLTDKNIQSAALYVPVGDDGLFTMVSVVGNYANTDNNATELEAMSEMSYNSFGDTFQYDWKADKELKKVVENKEQKVVFNKFDLEEYGSIYGGIRPFYDNNGDLIFLLMVEYDYSDVMTDLIPNLREKVVRDFLITIIIATLIILVSVYLVALRPLRKVKNTLDVYMEDKDCDKVENRLLDFRTKNEIGALAEGVVDFAREIEQYTADNVILATETAKVKTELDMAASIQKESLIKEFPENDKFEVFASMTPAKEVGGDFYDIFEIDENRMGFVIADVSGKGMPAALMMMAAMTSLRNYAPSCKMPSEVISKVNDELSTRKIMGMFVTVWLGILDTKTGVLVSSNAGHEFPAININGEYQLFKDRHSLVAGGMKGVKYSDCAVQLKPGDRVFVYTDGVPEATNADLKMFKEERMLEALNKEPMAEPEQLLKNVKAAVDEFVGEAEQFDDLTMMCIKYTG